jgi:hypothetical protein
VVVSDDGAVVVAAGVRASLPLRLAVTGAMVAPTASPIANVTAGRRMLGWLRGADNSLGWRNIILDIAESPSGDNINLEKNLFPAYPPGCGWIASKIRRQALLFPIPITGWLGSTGTSDLLGALRGCSSLHLGTALGRLGQRAFGRRRKRLPLNRLAGRIV